MEALSILKFWRNQTAVADVGSECAATATATTDEDETTDDEDSFFDLVFEPSDKNFHLVESPKSTKAANNNLSTVTEDDGKLSSSPVTTLRYPSISKPRSFSLSFKKSSKNDDTAAMEQSKHFVRDSSLRSKMMSENCETTSVSRYLRLIKPLVAKKGRVTEILTPFTSSVNASTRKLKQSGRVGSFKLNISNVGRSSWKGSSVFPASGTAELPRRRDVSLLEQQNDGIQGAILHCKRSYSSSSSSSSQDCSQLVRSASDPSHDKFVAQVRYSCEEQKRCSI